MKLNEAEIRKTWVPMLKESTGVVDPKRLNWMAEVANTHKLNEDNASLNPGMNVLGMGGVKAPNFQTGAVGSGDKMPSLLPMAMQVASQTFALDLLPIVPLNGPVGILPFMDAAYAGAAGPGLDAPAVTNADGTSNALEYFKAAGVTLDGNETVGDSFTDSDEGGSATYFFVGTSRLDGQPIFRRDGDVVQSNLLADFNKAVNEAGDAYDGPATGIELVRAMVDHIPGFVGNPDGTPYSRGAGEAAQDRLMGLTLFTKPVEADTYTVGAIVTREQVQDLEQYGVNAVAQVETILMNEITQSINSHILSSMRTLAATSVANSGVSLDITVDTGSTNGGATPGSEQHKILVSILGAANLIHQRGRRGAGNFAVVGTQVATALQAISGFQAHPVNNSISQVAGAVLPLGSIAGIDIYTDPRLAWNDFSVLVGLNGDEGTPGLIFMPYLMADKVETIAEGTMGPRVSIKTRYALVEAGHNPETSYFSFNISAGASGSILG